MEKYDEKSLVLLNWPRAERTVDGRWTRVWNIHFKEAIDPQISMENLSADWSEDDFWVSFIQNSADELTVHVTTHRRHGESDDAVFANYNLLEKLNERLGTIVAIQGQARDLWLPWRKKCRGDVAR